MSVADNNSRQLEALGEYVIRAKVGWFAIFPKTLAKQKNVAAANGRAPNVVVYRIRPGDERDHHVIPLTELAELLTDDTLNHKGDGSVRWDVNLKKHLVKVSHSHLSVDVEQYFRAPLAIELKPDGDDTIQPIDIDPPSRVVATTYRILRDTAVARKLKADHEYRCQICDTTIRLPDGTRYAEVHHLRPLGSPHDGPDVRENMVVLCPNHHAMCDYRVIRLSAQRLRPIAGHLVDPKFIAYHNHRVRKAGRSELLSGNPGNPGHPGFLG
jgi:hypothetical protein